MKNPGKSKSRQTAVLVLGSGYGALKVAKDLVQSGLPAVWVTKAQHFLETPAGLEDFSEWPEDLSFQFRPLYLRVTRHPLMTPLTRARLEAIRKIKTGYQVTIRQDPQYVDYDLCTGCSRCMDVCPLKDGRHPPLTRTPDYCPSRALDLDKREASPCRQNCPIGVNAQAYLALTAAGRFDEALAVIRQDNPLPGICGRVCHHPCEAVCRRAELDQPVAIRHIKRFLFDFQAKQGGSQALPPIAPRLGIKVAVVGSGPSGLTAAHYLNRAGVDVTVFEALSQAGGLLRAGINAFRLPRTVLDAEIEWLARSGITFRVNTPVRSLDFLLEQGYQAVLLATGTHQDLKLNIPGENLAGVHHCVDFLARLNLMGPAAVSVGERTVVIGGGNSAMDAARSALRLGARQVTVLAIETEPDLPAHPREVHEAREEGVSFVLGFAPTAFEDQDIVAQITARPAHWEVASNGAPRLIWDDGPGQTLPADSVIVAIGQRPHLERHGLDRQVDTGRGGRIQVNDRLQTSQPGVFAAGDVISGPSTVIQSMANGRLAAGRIVEFLTGQPAVWATPRLGPGVGDWAPIGEDLPRQPRQETSQRQPKVRARDFEEADRGLTVEQAVAEAKRCLQCGTCCECLACEQACTDLGAIDHFRSGRTLTILAPAIIVADSKELPPEMAVPSDICYQVGRFKGPADLMSVMMAGTAAVGQAMATLAPLRRTEPARPDLAAISPSDGRWGFFLCSCNHSLSSQSVLDQILQMGQNLPGMVHREIIVSACHPHGAASIAQAIDQHGLAKVILASCVCCPLEFQCISCHDQRTRVRMHLFDHWGLDRSRFEMVNLRDSLRLSQSEAEALDRAQRLLKAAYIRFCHMEPLHQGRTDIGHQVLILGGTEVGISCAENLALQGMQVTVIHQCRRPGEPRVAAGGSRKDLVPFDPQVRRLITQVSAAEIIDVEGSLGHFSVKAKVAGRRRDLVADVVCLTDESLLPMALPSGRPGLKKFYRYDFSFFHSPQGGLYRVMPVTLSRVDPIEAGAALASEVLTATAEAFLRDHQLSPLVDPSRCRGCGRCAEICPFKAVEMVADESGLLTARVLKHNCVGCGGCVGRCPVTAMDMPYFSNRLLKEMVAGVLSGGR